MYDLDPRLAAAVEREVAKAPDLTAWQVTEITTLLRTGSGNSRLAVVRTA